MKKALLALALLVVAAVVGLALTNKEMAPQASFTTLEGENHQFAALRGKVVLVNFWATSCPGCIQEMPDLVKTHQAYEAKGYTTVAVAMSYDPPNFVREYVKTNRLPFMVALDSDGGLARAFGEIQLTPTSILIDKEGRIVKRYLGVPNFTELNQLIEEKLKA